MAFSGGDPQDQVNDKQERAEEIASDPLPAVVGQPVDAYPSYEPEAASSSSAARRVRRLGWEVVQTLLLAALIFFAVRAMAQNFRVEGSSMEPGLHNGQFLLVNKAIYLKINLKTLSKYLPFIHPGDHPVRFLFRGPRRGDVIVFRFPQDPSRDFIKRVIGVPGDEVEVRSGQVFVNGVALVEPYVTAQADYNVPRELVPAGQYFVLGDNRNNSYDSHIWGMVPEGNIIGQAMFSYWPLSDFGGAGNRNINLGFARLPLP